MMKSLLPGGGGRGTQGHGAPGGIVPFLCPQHVSPCTPGWLHSSLAVSLEGARLRAEGVEWRGGFTEGKGTQWTQV